MPSDKQNGVVQNAASAVRGASGASGVSAVRGASGDGDGAREFRPRILAFCCNWCTYAGADLAGLNRMNYPADIKLLRVPCSGRVNPQYVLKALQEGCDGVLVCGCHPGDCHYATGNYYAKRRMMIFKRMLEFEGLSPERFQVRWISGSEAGKFRDTVTQVTGQIQALGPMENDAVDRAVIAQMTRRMSQGVDTYVWEAEAAKTSEAEAASEIEAAGAYVGEKAGECA